MTEPRPQRLLSFRSGGWVLAAAALVALLTLAALVGPRLLSDRQRPAGDGRHPRSYGFALSSRTVDPELIVASGQPRDGLWPLDDPPLLGADQIRHWREDHRGKYLVPSDRVIGVVAGGQARAYPVRILNWHEVVNDELGGVPIGVTYNPLCDAVAVFDRRSEDRTRRFGFSGLLLNSNLLLYDRDAMTAEGDKTGLWSQLLLRAVTGPEQGERLRALPCSLCRWDVWLQAHPETTVIEPDAELQRLYKRDPYSSYFGDERLRFPVRPLPAPPLKQRLLILLAGERALALAHPELARRAGPEGRLEVEFAGHRVRLRYAADPSSVMVESIEPPGDLAVLHALRFAWISLRGALRVSEQDE